MVGGECGLWDPALCRDETMRPTCPTLAMPACCRDKTLGAGTSKARGVLIPSRIGLALGHRIFENSRKKSKWRAVYFFYFFFAKVVY